MLDNKPQLLAKFLSDLTCTVESLPRMTRISIACVYCIPWIYDRTGRELWNTTDILEKIYFIGR